VALALGAPALMYRNGGGHAVAAPTDVSASPPTWPPYLLQRAICTVGTVESQIVW
jgi:hypothetical protein